MKLSAKIILAITGTALLVAFISLVLVVVNSKKEIVIVKNDAPPQENLGSRQDLDKCTPFPTGTSTPVANLAGEQNRYILEDNAFFITANATSTFECNVGNADMMDLHLFFVGSTTAAYPTWDYEFSFDGNEWYQPTLFSDQSDYKTEVGTSTYSFNQGAGSEGTTTINAGITPNSALKIRVNIGAGGGAASVYPEIIRRNQN